MKKYSHKSGRYTASEFQLNSRRIRMHGYYMKNLSTGQITSVGKELIENSSDWIEMVETPLNEYFSKKELELAFRQLLAGVLIGSNPISYAQKLRLEEIFFQHLEVNKK